MKNTTFRRMICVIMAVMLLLPAMAGLALAGDTEVPREITKEPSASSPTVEVSVEEGASYQWYEFEKESIEVTDELTEESSSYGEDGWTGELYEYGVWYFDVELSIGDKLTIEHNSDAEPSDFILLDMNSGNNVTSSSSNSIEFYIYENSTYCLLSNPQKEIGPVRAYIHTAKAPTEMQEQTTKTLTEYEIGNYYAVNVVYDDGEILESEIFEMVYSITSHPSISDLSVGTNADGDVEEYRWYVAEGEGIEYEVAYNQSYIEAYIYQGMYEDGLWLYEDGNYINLLVEGRERDILKIKVSEDFEGYVGLYYGGGAFETDADGVYCYEFEYVENLDFEIELNAGTGGVEIWMERGSLVYPVIPIVCFNENTMEMMPTYVFGEYDGEKWFNSYDDLLQIEIENDRDNAIVEVTVTEGTPLHLYYNGVEITASEEENNVYRFNIDTGEYTLEASCEDGGAVTDVKLIDGEKTYTMVDKFNLFDDKAATAKPREVNDGYYDGGCWYPSGESNEIDIELELEEGDILTVVPSEEFDGDVTLYVAGLSGLDIELVNSDGKYLFVADKDYYFDLELENCKKDFTAEITLQKGSTKLIDGQSGRKIEPTEDGIYYVQVEMKDGTVLLSSATEITRRVKFDTNGGTSLKPLVAGELTEIGTTKKTGFMLEGWYTDEELTQKVSLPMEITGLVTLYAKWAVCDHSTSEDKATCTEGATCTVCDTVVGHREHSWQADYEKTKDNHSLICKDCGAKLKSEAHTYTEWKTTKGATSDAKGEETRGCTVCGHTESRELPVTDGGLANGAVIGIIIGACAGASAISIAVAWFIFKKKSLKV